MPYGMPSIIMQGPVLQGLGVALNKGLSKSAPYRNWLQDHYEDLTSTAHPRRIADMLVADGVFPPGSIADQHVRRHWFPEPTSTPNDAWWPGLQPIEPIVKSGYANAIDENLQRLRNNQEPLPIDSYWVCIEDWNDTDPEYFQVAYTVTDRQITVIIFTPPEPHPEIARIVEPESVFITKTAHVTNPNLRQVGPVIEIGGKRLAKYQVWRLSNDASSSTAPLRERPTGEPQPRRNS